MKQQDIDLLISCVDSTTLSSADNSQSVKEFVSRVTDRVVLPATICVYPSMIEAAGLALGDSEVGITAVCGAFPSGQTYLEVKLLEVAMAIENGADEIDVVINIGEALEGNMEIVTAEIQAIKDEINGDALLKVILETGLLDTDELIYNTAMTVMEAGADFIKTSTGKTEIGATPQAVRVMCRAVRDFYNLSQRKVGVKVSGGVSDIHTAIQYMNIVKEELGQQWLCPALFRVGSSSL